MRPLAVFALASFALIENAFAQMQQRGKIDKCPGIVQIALNTQICCVGGKAGKRVLSSCPGWPVCTGPATTGDTRTSCATVIPLSDSNYDSLVSEASVSLSVSGTHFQTILGGGRITDSGTATQTSSNTAASAASTGAAADLRAQLGAAAGAFLAGAAMI